jgi:hypothetical protein
MALEAVVNQSEPVITPDEDQAAEAWYEANKDRWAWEEEQEKKLQKRKEQAGAISAMGYRNEVVLRGNVGKGPKLIPLTFGNAKQKAVFQVVTRSLRKRDGKWYEHDEWHRCVVVGAMAKLIAKKVGRGAHIYLEGTLQTEEWTDKPTGLKKVATRVVVTNFDVIQKGESK